MVLLVSSSHRCCCHSVSPGKPLFDTRESRRSADYNLYHALNGYIITLLNDTEGQGSHNADGSTKARVRIRRNPGFQLLKETYVGQCRAGVTCHLAVSKRGGHLRFSVDGKVLLEADDPTPWQGGHLGLRTYRTDLWWDYCKLTSPMTTRALTTFLFLTLPMALPAAGTRHAPDWADIAPKRVITHSNTRNDTLASAVAALQPGDQLVIAAGTYSMERTWHIEVSGTPEAPIWIVAEEGAKVVFTRLDAKQNVLNIGQNTPVHHLCLRGVEMTGGSHGLRLGQCSDVWIDRCHIHHTGAVCLSANSANTRRLFLTRNHIHHGGGHGEGMYLGANHGQFIMSESVIALNHIHDCKGEQGDGIEVKQGSWGNLIAENDIHDTQYPCITVYGTAGKPVNIIERNLCRRSADSAMQVQGEAIVRNNVLISGKGSGFASIDHQGKSLNLQVIHNTIINTGDAFKGSSWSAREGMVLANNVLYSRDRSAINFPKGKEGVTITGNIVLGDAPKQGTSRGRGLEDFVSLNWDGAKHDVAPTASAPFDHADAKFLLETDFNGARRTQSLSGAQTR